MPFLALPARYIMTTDILHADHAIEPFIEEEPLPIYHTTPDHPRRLLNKQYIEWIFAYRPRAELQRLPLEELPISRRHLDVTWLRNDAASINLDDFEEVWEIAPWLLSAERPHALHRHLPWYDTRERQLSIMPPPFSTLDEINNAHQRITELVYRPVNDNNPVLGLLIPEDDLVLTNFFGLGPDWSGWSEERRNSYNTVRGAGWGDTAEEGPVGWGINLDPNPGWGDEPVEGEMWDYLTGAQEWGNPPVPDPWGITVHHDESEEEEDTDTNQ